MKLQEIRNIAKMRGVAPVQLKKADLIRAIQRAEGNQDCFGTALSRECGQDNCLWRGDCRERKEV